MKTGISVKLKSYYQDGHNSRHSSTKCKYVNSHIWRMNRPLNLIKLKHQLTGLQSLRVSEQYVTNFTTVYNGKACSFSIWRVTFSTQFPSLTKASWHGGGRGRGRKSTPSPRGIAAVIANGPGEPIISCCARLGVPGVPITWRLPSPPHRAPRSASTTLLGNTAELRGRGGTRGHVFGLFP